MRGLGVIVNVLAVIMGSLIGLIMRKGISKRFEEIAMQACGISTLFIAISGAIGQMASISDDSLKMNGTMLMIISLIIGSLIGEAINIEAKIEHFGDFIKHKINEKKTAKQGEDRFTEGFMTSTLIICVGAMAVVGSIKDGLTGDASMIFAKSMMDFIIVVILAATMGIGVMFSAFSVLVYQGLITLFAVFLHEIFTKTMISAISFVGSVLIFGVGVNLIFGKKVRVGNMLPALFVAVICSMIGI